MMSDAQILGSPAVRNLRQASEARGMTFYVNPPKDIVPEFLGGFTPDALAKGADGGIVIAVRRRGDSHPKEPLAPVARRVADQKGWEFRAIYFDPPADETPPIAQPTPRQIHEALGEVAALTDGGHSAAALVTAWSALESLARLASAYRRSSSSGGFSPIQAIQILAEEGYIDDEAAERLRAISRLRNAVVHGDFSLRIDADQVRDMLRQLHQIARDIHEVTGAPAIPMA